MGCSMGSGFETNESIEAGSCPSTVEEYLDVIKRPMRWIDGLLLAGAAMVQRCNIIIWSKRAGSWCKVAVLRCGSDWKKAPSVPLILYKGHYMTLRTIRGGWPKDWALEAAEDVAQTQGIENDTHENLKDVLGRGGAENTPVRKKSRHEIPSEDEDLLRSCSSIRSNIPTSPAADVVGSKQKVMATRRWRPKQAVWICPECNENINLISVQGGYCPKRMQKHLQLVHCAVWQEQQKQASAKRDKAIVEATESVPGASLDFISMTKEEAEQKAQFSCPFCNCALPKLQDFDDKKIQYITKLAKHKHFAECSKLPSGGLSLTRFMAAFRGKHADTQVGKYSAKRSRTWAEKRMENMKLEGHSPTIIDLTGWPNFKTYGHCVVVCKSCRSILKHRANCRRICKEFSINKIISWNQLLERSFFTRDSGRHCRAASDEHARDQPHWQDASYRSISLVLNYLQTCHGFVVACQWNCKRRIQQTLMLEWLHWALRRRHLGTVWTAKMGSEGNVGASM